VTWEERGQPITWAARGAAPLEKGLVPLRIGKILN